MEAYMGALDFWYAMKKTTKFSTSKNPAMAQIIDYKDCVFAEFTTNNFSKYVKKNTSEMRKLEEPKPLIWLEDLNFKDLEN